MSNKDLQTERMKGYFIEAAREILKGEGVAAASVRNIADRAGYSYATLYNYFSDVKDLIFVCVTDFQRECTDQVNQDTAGVQRGRETLRAMLHSYIRYFIQYPGVFELFFLEKPSDISSNRTQMQQIYSFLDRLCEPEWQYCIDNHRIDTEIAGLLREQLNMSITGLLLFYLNRKQPERYDEFIRNATAQIDHLLEPVQ